MKGCSFSCSIKRGTTLQALDCHVHHVYWILNRIAYIRNGIPHKGRQCYDAVFDLRLGNPAVSSINLIFRLPVDLLPTFTLRRSTRQV